MLSFYYWETWSPPNTRPLFNLVPRTRRVPLLWVRQGFLSDDCIQGTTRPVALPLVGSPRRKSRGIGVGVHVELVLPVVLEVGEVVTYLPPETGSTGGGLTRGLMGEGGVPGDEWVIPTVIIVIVQWQWLYLVHDTRSMTTFVKVMYWTKFRNVDRTFPPWQ